MSWWIGSVLTSCLGTDTCRARRKLGFWDEILGFWDFGPVLKETVGTAENHLIIQISNRYCGRCWARHLVGQGILNAPGRWCLSHSRWVASGGAFPLGLMHG